MTSVQFGRTRSRHCKAPTETMSASAGAKQTVALLSTSMGESNRRVALTYRRLLKSLPSIIKVNITNCRCLLVRGYELSDRDRPCFGQYYVDA